MGSGVERFLQQTGGNRRPAGSDSLIGRFLDGEDEKQRLSATARIGQATPDSAARILKLEAQTGLPHDMIERNLDAIEAEANRADFDPAAFTRTSPIMAKWLAEHPKHLPLASEDLTRLSYLERQFRNIKDQFGAGTSTVRLSVLGTKAMLGTITPQERKEQQQLEEKMALANVSNESLDLHGLHQVPGAVAQQLPIQLPTFFAGAASAAVVGGATRSGKAAQVSWRIGAGVEAGRMEASLAYLDFEKIRDDRGEPLSRNTALGASLVVGIMNGSLEMLGAEEMVKNIPGFRQLTKEGMKQALTKATTSGALRRYLENIGSAAVTEGFTEFLQEMVTSTAGELAKSNQDGTVATMSWQELLGKIFSADHLAAAFEAGQMGAMGGGGMTTVTGGVTLATDVIKARRAKAATQVMAELGSTVQASKMMERLPDKMQEAVERLAKDGEVETLYAPVKQWKEYWQSQKIDPAQAAREVLGPEGADVFAEAERTDSDLPIPTGRYATTLAATEHHQFFINELRSGPTELSAREAQERIAELDAEETAAAEAEQDEATVTREASAVKVADKVRGQLEQTGFDVRTATNYARVYQDFFTRMSEKTGETPEQLFDRFGLKIARVDDATVDQSALHQDVDPEDLKRVVVQDLINEEDADRLITWHAAIKRNTDPKSFAMWEGGVRMKLDPETMTAKIVGAELPKDLQNKGWGTALYRALIDKAHGEGFRVFSDQIVSDEAQRIYDKLGRLGYEIFDRGFTDLPGLIEVAPAKVYNQDEVKSSLRKMLEGFHSKAERVISEKMSNRATVAEVRALLKDVKEEERRWTGIDEYLNSLEDNTVVPKERVLDLLEGNRIDLVEAVEDQDTALDARMERVAAMQREMFRSDINTFLRSFIDLERVTTEHGDYAWHAGLGNGWDKEITDFRIKDYYNILGGKTLTDKLTELFSTEPTIKLKGSQNTLVDSPMGLLVPFGPGVTSQSSGRRALSEMVFDLLSKDDTLDDLYMEMADEEIDEAPGASYSGYTLGGGTDLEDYRVWKLTIPGIEPSYETGHFRKDKNIVVHFRTSTRVDAEGNNMFFVEEIQSDWHQQGREKGYAGSKDFEEIDNTIEAMQVEREVVFDRAREVDDAINANEIGDPKNLELIAEKGRLREQISGLNHSISDLKLERQKLESAVPHAPFKNTWHELALKRIIRIAAQEGFESIGWTTGNQQADRYALEQIVDQLIWEPKNSSQGMLVGRKDGREVFRQLMHHRQELDSYIGSRVAENLLQSPTAEGIIDPDEFTPRVLEGERLRLGQGEGMRAFYDGMIPQFLKKFTKKYGAAVSQTTVEIGSAKGAELQSGSVRKGKEKFFRGDEEISKEQFDELVAEQKNDGGEIREEMEVLRSQIGFETDVHQLKFTPSLKRAALENEFTLYQSEWKHRAIRARFAGDATAIDPKKIFDQKMFPLIEFMATYGLSPDMLQDVELVISRNPKPREGKYRATIMLRQRLVEQGLVDEWMDRMMAAMERGDDPDTEPAPPIREETIPIGHIANDKIEEIESFMTDLQFAPIEMRQSIISELRKNAKKELNKFIGELDDIRRLASLAGDIPAVEQIAPVLEGWLQVREALENNDTKRLLQLQKELRMQAPEDITNLATKIPSLIDYTEFLQDDEVKEPKGRIRIGTQGIDIELLKKADLSTFIHESAHFFLEVMSELKDNEAVKTDLDTIKHWLGKDNDKPFTRDEHELFARGFERYLLEGKAPVPRLQMAFARFKAWLVMIYQSVTDLNVELSDEVRGVFDRMLASQAEIEAARKEQNAQPLFADPKAVGMTETEAAQYNEAHQQAQLAAEEHMTARIIQEFEREKSRVWNAERIKVRQEVGEEADEDATMRMWSLLARGRMPSGAELPEGVTQFKLDRVALEAQYPPEIVKRLSPKLFAKPGGKLQVAHPTLAADIFGFDSAESMLESLAVQSDPKQWIEKTTNSRMRSRSYDGTPLKSMDIPVEARKAVHNEKRAQLLQKELQILARTNLPAMKGLIRRLTRRLPKLEEVRDEAKRLINSKRINKIRPDVYRRAAATAAKDAITMFLKGDIEAAFEHKQRELLNHELYRAASAAKEEIKSGVKTMQKFGQPATQNRLAKAGASYLSQIEKLLERFDFSPVTRRELASKESLREFLDEQQALGLTPDIPDHVMNEAYRKNYNELTLDEFRGIVESAKMIRHLATLKNKLLASNRSRNMDEAVENIVTKMRENHKIDRAEPLDLAPDLTGRIKRGARGLIAAHTKMEFLFEHMDGNMNNGPAWSYLFQPLAQAEGAEHSMNMELIPKLKEIFAVYPKAERATWFWRKTTVKEVGLKMTKANMLAVALNWGNEGNRRALMDGYGWTEEQVNGVLNKLTAQDWITVQKIWDLIDSYWPQIEAMEKEINGVAPEKVEAVEIVNRHGTFRGGYYPIIFDAQLSWRQGVLDTKRQATEMFGGHWAKAMTRQGHTKERTNSAGKPIKLDLSPLTEHLTNVIHDLTHRRAVIDIARLTQREEVRTAIENGLGREMYRQIHPWLVNVAAGQRNEFYNPIESLLARGRMGATIVNMGYKMTTALTQVLSFTNTIKEVGPKYAALGLSDVWGKPWKLRESWDFVVSRSPFMDNRVTSYDRDVRDALLNLNVAGVKPGPLSFVGAYTGSIRDSFFMFIGLMDMAVSLPTWMGAYRKAMDGEAEGIMKGDEDAAVGYADKIVRETQGVGAPKDMATVQRGPEAYKIFAMFYSYFGVLFNQFAKTQHQLRMDKKVGRYVASLAMLWFVPAVLQDLMLGRAPDPDDDEEEWYAWLAKSEARYPFQTVIILRDVINGMDRYGYEPSAALDMFSTIAQTLRASGKVMTDEEFTRAEAENAALAAGYVTKLPSRQLWQTGEYLHDWMTGNVTPENPLDAAWRALVTGAPKDE